MPIAAFIGPHPRHPSTERAHAIATVGPPQNEARRAAILLGIGPIPPQRIWTAEDLAATPKLLREPPPRPGPTPITPTQPPPVQRTVVFSVENNASTPTVPFGSISLPFRSRLIDLQIAYNISVESNAIGNAFADILLRVTQQLVTNPALPPTGVPLLQYTSAISGNFPDSIVVPSKAAVRIPAHQPIPYFPAAITLYAALASGVGNNLNVALTLEQITEEEMLRDFTPDVPIARLFGRWYTAPRPPSHDALATPAGTTPTGPPRTLRVSVLQGGNVLASREIEWQAAAPEIRSIARANMAAARTGGRQDPTVQVIG